MNFTREQIYFACSTKAIGSELILNIANSENGTNILMQMTFNAFVKSDAIYISKIIKRTTQMAIEKEN